MIYAVLMSQGLLHKQQKSQLQHLSILIHPNGSAFS